MSGHIISADSLVKHWGKVKAVNGLSFDVTEGECFGLLGPNGAGKTTTLEMMEGLTPADQGSVMFRGRTLDKEYPNHIGIQFQNTALQDFQTVRESLALFARIYPQTVDLEELITLCQLDEFIDRDVKKLSGGQRQRLLLAISLVNNPSLVFLDEPTTGLDPQSRRNFWSLIESIKQAGKTVLLTTHYMEEAEQLCDRIALLSIMER